MMTTTKSSEDLITQIDSVLFDLEYLLVRESVLQGNLKTLSAENQSLTSKTVMIQQQQETVALAEQFYQQAIDLIYMSSVGQLTTTINRALQYIFYDKNYKINIEISDKRGKSLTFFLVKQLGEIEYLLDAKHSCGAGIRNVLSFLIHSYYLINKGSKFLILDEAYNYVSADYRDRFYSFVNAMAKEKDIIIILITHFSEIGSHCNKEYILIDGEVQV